MPVRRYRSFRDVLKSLSDDELLLHLRDRDAGLQRKAAIELGRRKCARAVDDLVRILKSGENRSRAAAADALGLIGDERAGAALVETLRAADQPPAVRDSCAYALCRLSYPPAVDALLDALSDPAPSVRVCAASALAAIGESRAFHAVLLACHAETDHRVKEALKATLQQLHAPGVSAGMPLIYTAQGTSFSSLEVLPSATGCMLISGAQMLGKPAPPSRLSDLPQLHSWIVEPTEQVIDNTNQRVGAA